MPRKVGLVTTDTFSDQDLDLPILIDALRESGLEANDPHWRDPAVEWSSYDVIIMRSPWDYMDHTAEFLDWLDAVAKVTTVWNCPDLIRWNLDKHYLADLEGSGVSVVPTQFCNSPEQAGVAIDAVATAQLVVKPTISAASKDTGWFDAGDSRAKTLANTILEAGKTVMVQPFIESVAGNGESALVFFEGHFSHALRKGPLLELGGRTASPAEAKLSRLTPTSAELDLAEVTMRAIPGIIRRRGCTCDPATPLYARIDIVADEAHGPLLLEAELFEPSFFVRASPGSERRFAQAVTRRLA